MSDTTKYTPGPWDYVPSTEHHGSYVTTEFGSTVVDAYAMSDPSSLSVHNGGTSRPIHHMHEMADANARLIAAAPELLEALQAWISANKDVKDHGMMHTEVEARKLSLAAISKALGK